VGADEAVAINRMLVAQFGVLDAGVCDENLLKVAHARPLNKWHYDEPKPTLFVLAAAYAFGIAKGQVLRRPTRRLRRGGHLSGDERYRLRSGANPTSSRPW
jgi:hypothetical protein